MKRRSFFGFAAGAAVAGPGLAKAAAAKVVQDLALGQGANALAGSGMIGYPEPGYGLAAAQGPLDNILRAKSMLDKLTGMSAAKRAEIKRRLHVGALDPDLAGYHSLSIGTRIDMQRERNLEKMIAERRGVFERMAIGLDPYNSDDPI